MVCELSYGVVGPGLRLQGTDAMVRPPLHDLVGPKKNVGDEPRGFDSDMTICKDDVIKPVNMSFCTLHHLVTLSMLA